ncbi:hypothetical protein [Brunnivagina elsteri]|nr:hypothetical protein [Calothrix elsteri]
MSSVLLHRTSDAISFFFAGVGMSPTDTLWDSPRGMLNAKGASL